MIVVTYNHVGVQFPPTALYCFKERSFKPLAGILRKEKFFSVVPTTNGVINRSLELNALFPWHDNYAEQSGLIEQFSI
jgi:hypothetical protein